MSAPSSTSAQVFPCDPLPCPHTEILSIEVSADGTGQWDFESTSFYMVVLQERKKEAQGGEANSGSGSRMEGKPGTAASREAVFRHAVPDPLALGCLQMLLLFSPLHFQPV